MRAAAGAGEDGIQVHSIVVITRTFAARPSSIPDIRSFVRQHLTQVPLSDDDVRQLTARVVDVLLDAAGTGRAVEVALRIFTSCAEVDVLQTSPGQAIGNTGYVRTSARPGEDRGQQTPAHVTAVRSSAGGTGDAAVALRQRPTNVVPHRSAVSFAAWLAEALRREGMTMEAAARQLKVSVKTVSRWVRGTTEPRLHDLSRIREIFGELPFP